MGTSSLLSRSFTVVAVVAIGAVLPPVAGAQTGSLGVWCKARQCHEETFGLGTGPVESVCRTELQNRCDTGAVQACGGGVPGRALGDVNVTTKIFGGDPTCNQGLGYEANGTGTCRYQCETTGGGGGGTDDMCNSCDPLLVDFGQNGFDLTGTDEGVLFDIDADGSPEVIGWTSGSAADAFLALDRDGNGLIDSGAELFGGDSSQPPTATPNGFLTLAVFDRPENGGNADGMIGRQDAVWSQLLLWVDASHDGYSQSSELSLLADSQIDVVLLDYKESAKRDRYGNRYQYRSRALSHGASRKVDVVDVFFVRRWW
jgi:hypothetical protein